MFYETVHFALIVDTIFRRALRQLPDGSLRLRNEFAGADKTLKAGLEELKKTAEGIKDPIQKDITNLHDIINKLIYKPIVKGTVAERSLAVVWQEAFLKDQVKVLGGPGRTDILVVPYLNSQNIGFGEKIVVERKAGNQGNQATG